MRLRFVALAVAATLAASCGRDPAGPEEVGTYALRTVNGSPLPYTVADDALGKREVVAGTVTLSPFGSFSVETTARVTRGGAVTTSREVTTGSYSVSGSTLRLTSPGSGRTDEYSISGDEITFVSTSPRLTLVYRR